MSIALSCPARRQSSHYLPAEALPCWCEVHPVAAGSALLLRFSPCFHRLHSAAESLCCIGLPRQRQAASAMGVYLSRGDCLGNGGLPSPTELRFLGPSPPGAFGIAILSVPLCYPKRCVPAIPWAGPLSKFRSVSSSALSSLRLPVQQGTRGSAPCAEHCVGPAAATPAAGFTSQNLCLSSHVSFIPRNFPVLWATKISLEMRT